MKGMGEGGEAMGNLGTFQVLSCLADAHFSHAFYL